MKLHNIFVIAAGTLLFVPIASAKVRRLGTNIVGTDVAADIATEDEQRFLQIDLSMSTATNVVGSSSSNSEAELVDIVNSLNEEGIQVELSEAMDIVGMGTKGIDIGECRMLVSHILNTLFHSDHIKGIKGHIEVIVDKICGEPESCCEEPTCQEKCTPGSANSIGARNRLLEDANYNPTPEEAFQAAKETNGDLDAGFVLQENLLTPEECALLVAFIDVNDSVPVSPNTAENDHVVVFRKKSPLEDIIGLERAQDLYKFFKEHSNGAPVTQVWMRRLTGKSGLFMGLHTDEMPYQLKIALNGDFEDGNTLVVDRTGARRIQLETGAGYIHDKGLVHGHMPHSGEKYILYLISDPNPRMKDLAAETLAL